MRLKNNLLFFLLLVFVSPLFGERQNTQSINKPDFSQLQQLLLPIANQVFTQVNQRLQKPKINNNNFGRYGKKKEIHFISVNENLYDNYFIKDNAYYVSLDILKYDESFYQTNNTNFEFLKNTIINADLAKLNGEVNSIVFYLNIPFYTYYQHSQPGLLNIFKNDPIYEEKIDQFSSIYLDYIKSITDLIMSSQVDIVVSKCDNVVYEHNIIDCGNGRIINSYLIETEQDLLDIENENQLTKATADTVIVPIEVTVKLYHYIPDKLNYLPATTTNSSDNKLNIDFSTPDGIDAVLTLLNSLGVTVDDIRAVSPLDVRMTSTIDLRAATPINVDINTFPTISIDPITINGPIDINIPDQLDINVSGGLDTNITNSININITEPLSPDGRLDVRWSGV
ncbi:MAG: hypothetical protein ABIF12_00900 [bacterium]